MNQLDLQQAFGNIEDAIEERLRIGGLDVQDFDIDSDPTAVRVPAVNIALWDISFTSINMAMTRWRANAVWYVTNIIADLRDEKSRRRAMYAISAGEMALLSGWKPTVTVDGTEETIDVRPFRPDRFRRLNVVKSPRMAFVLQMRNSFVFSSKDLDLDAAVEVLTIGLNYMIKPDDDTADAQHVVDVS